MTTACDEKTCSTCAHWHRTPVDPANITGAPPQGQCRERPPAVFAFPQQGGVVTVCAYPTVPAAHPACARHRLTLLDG